MKAHFDEALVPENWLVIKPNEKPHPGRRPQNQRGR
jgi:hypothetical protein